MLARDLMTSKPKTVTADESIATAARVMSDNEVGMVPVVTDLVSMQLAGVITDRDIAARCVARGHAAESCVVRDHITSPPLVTVHSTADADTLVDLMARNQLHRILVLSGKDEVIGVVSLADLAVKLGPWEPAKIGRLVEQISQPLVAQADL